MSGDDDYEIPESGAVFTFGRSRFAENLSSHFFVRNDPVLEISCGDDHTALICTSGRVFLFGRNDYGQLGFGHNKTVNKPSCLKYLKPFHSTHIACGKGHTIVSTSCNRLFTFGCNSDGQLGIGDLIDRTVPQMIKMSFLTENHISAVAAGCHHSAFLTEDGNVYLWGCNNDGQCGVDEEPYLVKPHKLEFNQPINSLSCGYYHTAFTSDGYVYTFGEGDSGKLGNFKKSGNFNPEKVEITEKCVSVKCGGNHSMVLTESGEVYAFGSNFSGQLGVQNISSETSTPTKVLFPNEKDKIVFVSCGESHSAFLSENGTLYTCGDSRYGKLCNDDDSVNFMTPTLIDSLENYFCTFVSCGGCHTMVLAKIRNANHLPISQNIKEALPPLKTIKESEVNEGQPTSESVKESSVEENIDKKNETKLDDLNDYDSKSNTESNLINEEMNSYLDEIYTEIEDVTEKNDNDFDLNYGAPNKEVNEKETEVVTLKENPIKKLLKVFKRKKSESAILLTEETQKKVLETATEYEGTAADHSSKPRNQNNSKACVIL